MSCPSSSTLTAYAEGRLVPEEDVRVSRHIRGCASCTRALRDLAARAVTAVARSLTTSQPSPQGPPAALPERGSTIGRYLVLDLVGEGGMGVVLSAYDPELNRRVALKLLRVDLEATDQAEALRERLRREAQVMARLSHPNVVAVYDVGPYGQGIYLAMEWVEGSDLWRWQSEAPHSSRDVLAHYVDAARGLAAAHRAGIVHRDFKPDNVLVGQDGRVRVTDFGLARKQRVDGGEERELTGPGAVVGTPGYMAPEQIRGLALDGRADQFSFCAALYEALYGRQPFAGGSEWALLARAVLDGKLRPPPVGTGVPGYLWPVLQRGLSTDPSARFPNMEALIEALQADPRARRLRMATLALGAMATLALGASVRTWVARDRTRCARAAEAQLAGWAPESQERLHQHLLSALGPTAEAQWGRTSVQIGRYAALWIQARTEICESERASGDSAEVGRQDLLRREEACLTDQRRDFDEALSDLEHGEAQVTALGPELIAHLDPPASCRSISPPRLSDGDDELLWRSLARVKVLVDEARISEAEPLARQVIETARSHQAREVLARALYELAYMEWENGRDPHDVDGLTQEAARAAQCAGDDQLAALARLMEFDYVSLGHLDEDDARSSARRASLRADSEAAVQRAGDTVFLRTKLLTAEGNVDVDQGDLDKGIAELESALALGRQVEGEEQYGTNTVLVDLAASYEEVGDYPRSMALFREAVAFERRTFGPDHVDTAQVEVNLGWAEDLGGQLDAGLADVEHGAQIYAGLNDVARSSFRAWSQLTLGQVLNDQSRFAEARPHLDEALRIYSTEESPDPTEMGALLTALARSELEAGRMAEAQAEVVRALDLLAPRRGLRRELAESEFLLARVLAARSLDPSRAQSLARSAEKRFAAAVNGDQVPLAEVRAWLRDHPAP